MILQKSVDTSEVSRCLLCSEAPCATSCPKSLKVDDILMSVYFDNEQKSIALLGSNSCLDCDAPCEKACVLSRIKKPVAIQSILMALEKDAASVDDIKLSTEPDLSISICSVKLENPFLLSSSVVASNYEMCAKAFDMGWAGVSFKTLCSFEQHEASPRFSCNKSRGNSFYGFKNIEQLSNHSVEEDLQIFKRLKSEYPSKVIVASIMGKDEAEWTRLAFLCEDAGADVIECNFSCPNMEDSGLGVTIGQSAELIERFTKAVKKGTHLPVLAKMTPNITDMVPMALAAKRGGADGIAAINTINSVTGVNIDTLVAEPSIHGQSMVGGYSGAAVKPIALRFISDLANCNELMDLHISGMGGIETWRDALEFILMGSKSLQSTTAVMQYGYRIIRDLKDGISCYLKEKGIVRLTDLIGASASSLKAHDAIERDTILLPRFDRARCIGCGRCQISCFDGGHQAIVFDSKTRKPKLDGKKCVGCHLCRLVCPVQAIGVAGKRIDRRKS